MDGFNAHILSDEASAAKVIEAVVGVAALDAEVPEDEDAVSAEATEGRP